VDEDCASTCAAAGPPGSAGSHCQQPEPAVRASGPAFEAEIASYQNRPRQYDPGKRRFAQRDPLQLVGSHHARRLNGLCDAIAMFRAQVESDGVSLPSHLLQIQSDWRCNSWSEPRFYEYVRSNPTVRSDPTGLLSELLCYWATNPCYWFCDYYYCWVRPHLCWPCRGVCATAEALCAFL
jgi:hypothetical protein